MTEDVNELVDGYRAEIESALAVAAGRIDDQAADQLRAAVLAHLDAIEALRPALLVCDSRVLPEHQRHVNAIAALLRPHIPPIGGTALSA